MQHNVFLYIFIMAAVTYLIRVLPLTLIRKEIKNTFLKSFLFYVPYVTLAVMTFPAIIEATNSTLSGILALISAIVAAYFNLGLMPVSAIACAVVFIAEIFIK